MGCTERPRPVSSEMTSPNTPPLGLTLGLIYGDLSTSRIDQSDRRYAMREIQASDAKTHLPRLLDEVERGETVVITRHGRAIARIVPEAHRRQEEVDRAVAGIKALRERTGKISLDELFSARHEGHKY